MMGFEISGSNAENWKNKVSLSTEIGQYQIWYWLCFFGGWCQSPIQFNNLANFHLEINQNLDVLTSPNPPIPKKSKINGICRP